MGTPNGNFMALACKYLLPSGLPGDIHDSILVLREFHGNYMEDFPSKETPWR